VLRRIFGPKRKDLIEGLRKSHDIVRIVKSMGMMDEEFSMCMEIDSAYKILVGKLKRKKPR
jgi:hypothetical protein